MNQTTGKSDSIKACLYIDPACPFGYSASPALRTIEWRYRDQIEWRLVMIALSEPGDPPKMKTGKLAANFVGMRDRHGMPFATEPKPRSATSERACKAIIAARILQPGFEWRVLRTLQLLNFNTPLLLDDDAGLRAALSSVSGLDYEAVMASLDSEPVKDGYLKDRAEARSAAGGPAEFQGKAATDDGGARYTAPSVVFSRGGTVLEVGGFQPVEAYDVIIANLGTDLKRHEPPEEPLEALSLYPGGLSTQEVAAIMTEGNDPQDRTGAERSLIGLLDAGKVKRIPMGHDAIWLAVR